MKLTEDIKKSIKLHSLKEAPKECCGLIVSRDNSNQIFNCRNVSNEPTKHFSICTLDYVKASDSGDIKAVYHSHPSTSEKFSSYDMLNSKGHDLFYILYNIEKDIFSTFDPKKEKTFIHDKPFVMGKTDCYNFVTEYYKSLNINLSDSPKTRDEEWQSKMPNLPEEIASMNPSLREIDDFSLAKKHDILLFKMIPGKKANHAGVYLGDKKIIHRPRNMYTTIENMSEKIIKKIYKIYRNEQFN